MAIEKRKKPLSSFELFGEDLNRPDGPLEERELKIREGIFRWREKQRRQLIRMGVKVSEEKNTVKKEKE